MTETIENLRDFNYYPFSSNINSKYVLAEYIWIDGTGEKLRSKTKVYLNPIKNLDDLEWWTYDGSSTDQAVTDQYQKILQMFQDIQYKEIFIMMNEFQNQLFLRTKVLIKIYLKPVCMVKDPFRGDPHLLVLCETYLPDKKTPARYNFRWLSNLIMEKAKEHKPWFGIEQEYFLFKRTGTTHLWPLGWPNGGFPYPQGRYYCSIGERNNFGRALAEAHLRACLNAGLKIAGLNAEVAPSQWEFQIGIAEGIEIGDHMWLARYILERIGEEFGIDINYDPKPIQGDWNGSGSHCNYSTETTRSEGGYKYIVQNLMPILEKQHKDMIRLYGINNQLRLTGKHETGRYDSFSWGDGSRGCSVRVPIITKELGQGYFEDRRPAANIDPYLVSAALVDVTCLNSEHLSQLLQVFETSLKPLQA